MILNIYRASIDLKDKFYSIPIYPKNQKYLQSFVVLEMY